MKMTDRCNFTQKFAGYLFTVVVGITLMTVARASEIQETLPLVEHGTSTYYTLATIEGIAECPFVVDTGAGYTTINEVMLKDLQKQDLVEYKRSITGVMADGSKKIVKIYLVKKMVLGRKCSFLDVEVAVLPGNSRAILGMSLLKRTTSFTINPRSASLSVACNGTGNLALLGPDI